MGLVEWIAAHPGAPGVHAAMKFRIRTLLAIAVECGDRGRELLRVHSDSAPQFRNRACCNSQGFRDRLARHDRTKRVFLPSLTIEHSPARKVRMRLGPAVDDIHGVKDRSIKSLIPKALACAIDKNGMRQTDGL